jgi:integral membrane protein (TIGR01906 family)
LKARFTDLGERVRAVLTSRWIAWAGAALFVVSVPVALIGTNVRLLFGEQRLYNFAVNRYADPAITRVERPEMRRAMSELRSYLFGPDELLRIDVTDISGEVGPLFNPREVLHMRDVRHLIQGIFRAQEAALVVALGYPALRVLSTGRAGARGVARLLWLGTAGFNLAAIAFGITAALGFDRLFTRFHELSFSNDMWMLDPDRDRLVQVFPFEFWQLSAGLLIGLTLAESVLLGVAARLYLARAGPEPEPRAVEAAEADVTPADEVVA